MVPVTMGEPTQTDQTKFGYIYFLLRNNLTLISPAQPEHGYEYLQIWTKKGIAHKLRYHLSQSYYTLNKGGKRYD